MRRNVRRNRRWGGYGMTSWGQGLSQIRATINKLQEENNNKKNEKEKQEVEQMLEKLNTKDAVRKRQNAIEEIKKEFSYLNYKDIDIARDQARNYITRVYIPFKLTRKDQTKLIERIAFFLHHSNDIAKRLLDQKEIAVEQEKKGWEQLAKINFILNELNILGVCDNGMTKDNDELCG